MRTFIVRENKASGDFPQPCREERRSRILIKIYGMLFTVVIGMLLHNIYAWSDKSLFVAVLAPVNGSVFQQLKLLFTPYMLWTLVEYTHYGQYEKNFIPIKGVALFAGMMMIVLLLNRFITVMCRNNRWMQVTAFFIAVPTTFCADYLLTVHNLSVTPATHLTGSLFLFFTALAMAIFTFYPPDHPLFTDPNRSLH